MIPQTSSKTLLSSFLVLVSNSSIVIWSNSDISIFQGIGKIHGKTRLRHHYVMDHFRKKSIIFRDMRTHGEHNTKDRLSISCPSPEKPSSQIRRLKENWPNPFLNIQEKDEIRKLSSRWNLWSRFILSNEREKRIILKNPKKKSFLLFFSILEINALSHS